MQCYINRSLYLLDNFCCVLWPVNWCFAHCFLVTIIVFGVSAYFPSKTEKRKSTRKIERYLKKGSSWILLSSLLWKKTFCNKCILDYFVSFYLLFSLFCPKKMLKHWKRLFSPANSMWSTHWLVEIHNSL